VELINAQAEAYAAQFTSAEGSDLHTIAATTAANHPMAHMLSGHVQGKFLELIATILQPKKILEIGTFTGYSAICLAKGLAEGGELHTIELREADAATAKQNFNMAGMQDKIFLHTGNAKEIIPALPHTWDMVFIDADKTAYIDYYKLVLPAVKKGGVIIADNVLFHGQVLEQPVSGKNAKAIQAFNEWVKADETTEQVLLTIRDGLLFIIKK